MRTLSRPSSRRPAKPSRKRSRSITARWMPTSASAWPSTTAAITRRPCSRSLRRPGSRRSGSTGITTWGSPRRACVCPPRPPNRSGPRSTTSPLTRRSKPTSELGLAGQLKLTGDFDAAAEAYEAAIEIEPDDREVRYLHAEALYRAGRGLEALPLLTDLDDSANEDYRVPALIADVYLEQGQTDYALSSLQRAIRKAEENGSASVQAGVHIRLGLLQRDLGRAADALASFQRAAAVDPASWQAHYNLGLSYLEAGRISESITPLETAVVQAPASGEARLALATAYDQAGSAAEALEQAESALSLLNDELLRVQARFLAGRSEYHLGDYQAAAGHLAIVVEARPGDPQAQLWAGLTEYQRGDYGAAAQYYERAVQLAPASREARANLAAAYLADARYTDAEFIYLELIELDPQDRQSHYNLGWALLSQNRRAAARDAFQAAAALDYAPAAEALAEYFQ